MHKYSEAKHICQAINLSCIRMRMLEVARRYPRVNHSKEAMLCIRVNLQCVVCEGSLA